MTGLPVWFPQGDSREFLYDVTLDDIRQYFLRLYTPWVSLFEFGVGGRRFDLIRVDCYRQKIAGFEFKISKYDLLKDHKWPRYLEYCNTLSFAMPMAITESAQKKLPSNVGIIGFYKWRYKEGLIHNFIVDQDWLRKPRGKELPQETYIRVISLLLNRAKFRSGEIF